MIPPNLKKDFHCPNILQAFYKLTITKNRIYVIIFLTCPLQEGLNAMNRIFDQDGRGCFKDNFFNMQLFYNMPLVTVQGILDSGYVFIFDLTVEGKVEDDTYNNKIEISNIYKYGNHSRTILEPRMSRINTDNLP